MNHGTRGKYREGCRCEPCTEANRIYSREYSRRRARARRELQLPLDPRGGPHGTNGRYNHGCRCIRCKLAAREYRKQKQSHIPTRKVPDVPLEPLLERVASNLGQPVAALDTLDISKACGVSTRTVARWKQTQQIPSRDVDDIAIRLGWHPAAIWGAKWYTDTYDTGEVA